MADLDPDAHIWKTVVYEKQVKAQIPKSSIKYDPVILPDYFNTATTETVDGGRRYIINEVVYPSITTVIKATDKEGAKALAKWRNDVGHEKAQKISTESAVAGTKWHAFCEKYLTQQVVDWRYFTEPSSSFQANNIAAALDEQVDTVIASEVAIKSDYYGVAGRMDVGIKLKDGRYAILDYKTGRKPKTGNRLRQAAIQGCFYGDALTEHAKGVTISTVVIMQILKNQILWQESPIEYWRPMLKNAVRTYAKIIKTL